MVSKEKFARVLNGLYSERSFEDKFNEMFSANFYDSEVGEFIGVLYDELFECWIKEEFLDEFNEWVFGIDVESRSEAEIDCEYEELKEKKAFKD